MVTEVEESLISVCNLFIRTYYVVLSLEFEDSIHDVKPIDRY